MHEHNKPDDSISMLDLYLWNDLIILAIQTKTKCTFPNGKKKFRRGKNRNRQKIKSLPGYPNPLCFYPFCSAFLAHTGICCSVWIQLPLACRAGAALQPALLFLQAFLISVKEMNTIAANLGRFSLLGFCILNTF